MKIIHTSDWHLGQNFYRYDRDDEHRHFFNQLNELLAQERPDALVVSGDIFHNAAPSTTALRLFVESVIKLHDTSPETTIVITAGNHDSGSRLEADRELWQRLHVHIVGGCHRREDCTFAPEQFIISIDGVGHIIAAPYFHSTNYPAACVDTPREDRQRAYYQTLIDKVRDTGLPIVLMAHLAVTGCDTQGHEDISAGGMHFEDISLLGEGYDYLALGHIHKPQKLNDRAYYCGTPISVNFSEDFSHYVNLIEIEQHGDKPDVHRKAISQLRSVKTVPADGAPLDEALTHLSSLADDDDSYIRVLIDQEEVIAADAEDRVRKIIEGKACRFCEIRRKPRPAKSNSNSKFDITDIDDFTSISPMELAKSAYSNIHGIDMNDELSHLLNQVIEDTEAHNHEN